MSEPKQPIVMLRLEIQHGDGLLFFERTAPIIPREGFLWHKGLLFDDGGDDLLHVAAVRVKLDGSVQVVFDEQYSSNITDQSIKEFTDLGWTFVKEVR